MKKLSSVLLASALAFAPASAFAEVSLSEMLTDDASFSLSHDLNLDLAMDSEIAHGRRGPAPQSGYRPAPAPVHHTTTVRHYRTNVRPVVRPVVVVEQPSTVVVESSSSSSSSSAPERVGSVFGMGIRGVGLIPSATVLDDGAELKSKIDGGVGFYLKVRPIRWFSIELINDYLFGHYQNVSDCDKYFKVPLVVGARGHVFDYGNLDVYGVAAFSTTFVTLDDGNDFINQEERYVQFGGQFGAGVSLIAGGFEIGLDVRYTIDEAPDKVGLSGESVDQDKPVHGFLFSLNLGFAL